MYRSIGRLHAETGVLVARFALPLDRTVDGAKAQFEAVRWCLTCTLVWFCRVKTEGEVCGLHSTEQRETFYSHLHRHPSNATFIATHSEPSYPQACA